MRRGIPTRNYPLWIGLILTGLIVLLAIFGSRLAPLEPMAIFSDIITVGEERYVPARQPVPPLTLEQFPLGSDIVGRDLLSRMLWGIRPTLVLCSVIALLRIVLGVALGMASGWFGGLAGRAVDLLIHVSLSVPILLFGLVVISYVGHNNLPYFILALTATGWAGTAVYVRNSTLLIKQAPYIMGARAVGVPPLGILRRYVLPQLWPTLPALMSFELAAALIVVAELGFLGMFIGDAFVIMVENPTGLGQIPDGLTANYPELAQMLSDFWRKMLRAPWEVAFVGAAIFLTIFAFNMLGEGLRRQMDVTRPRQMWRRRPPEVTQPAVIGRATSLSLPQDEP